MKKEIRRADGLKYTIGEFFKPRVNEKNKAYRIISDQDGEWIWGNADYILGHLDKVYYGFCIQAIEEKAYETVVYVR